MAEGGDVTNDLFGNWPESRRTVQLGPIILTSVAEENAATQNTIIFDAIPRVEGIESSADPLLNTRATTYLISGRERQST